MAKAKFPKKTSTDAAVASVQTATATLPPVETAVAASKPEPAKAPQKPSIVRTKCGPTLCRLMWTKKFAGSRIFFQSVADLNLAMNRKIGSRPNEKCVSVITSGALRAR